MNDVSLEDYLQSLCGEGTKVDSGQFELDAQAALAKLGMFQFAEATTYFWPLLAAAGALGARRLSIHIRPGHLLLEYACAALSRAQLESIFGYAFSRQHGGLRHLALGLLGARRTVGFGVEVASGPWAGRLGPRGPELRRQSLSLDGLRVQIRRTGWAGRLGLGRPLPLPTRAQVEKRSGHSGMELAWGQESAICAEPPAGEYFAEGGLSAWLSVAVEQPSLVLVVDGLAFAADPAMLGFPWASGVVRGPFQLDISYQRVVRDAGCEQILGRVREWLEKMVLQAYPEITLDPFCLDLHRPLIVRWSVDDELDRVTDFYQRLLDLTQGVSDRTLEHPIYLGACLHLRQHESGMVRFHASLLLTRLVGLGLWPEANWQNCRKLAHEVFGPATVDYRMWLLQCWLKERSGVASVDEMVEIMPRDADCPGDDDHPLEQQVVAHLGSGRFFHGSGHFKGPKEALEFSLQAQACVPRRFRHLYEAFGELEIVALKGGF